MNQDSLLKKSRRLYL